jgi:spermidine synthase
VQKTALYIPTRSDKLGLQVEVRETLVDVQTDFQRVQVVDTVALGRVLLLDGHVQLSELDEHAYHESLVQVPLCSVESPTRALVVGGGDGGVLRELCRNRSLSEIVMVEIDEGVIKACREAMPFVSAGAFDDPRVNVQIGDAFDFAKRAQGEYDLIVVDCTDVYEEEDEALSEDLFTPEFYADLRRLLSDKGFVVSQADNLVFCPYSTEAARAKFEGAFDATGSYWCIVPSFGGFSGFVWGSKGASVSATLHNPPTGLRYLDATTYALAMKPVPFSSCF